MSRPWLFSMTGIPLLVLGTNAEDFVPEQDETVFTFEPELA